MGNEGSILWPDNIAMSRILSLARPRNQILTPEPETTELLWPAKLINQQARLAQRKDYSRPVAIAAFVFSIIASIAIGPVQLVLVATMLDYNWVTATYFPRALHYIFFFATLISLVDLAALILAWRSSPQRTYQTIVLSAGSLALLGTILFAGCVTTLQPHQLTLVLLGITLAFIMINLLVSKQYFSSTKNSTVTKAILSLMMACSVLVASLNLVNLVQSRAESNPERLTEMTIEMQNAKLRDVPMMLSDLTYLLCNGKYKLVFLAEDKTNGLFECAENGEVYSVRDLEQRNINSIRGAATYLGTTRDKTISMSFPTALFLYRNIPGALAEDELVLMYPASSEVELIDNVTPQLLSYWNDHNERGLYVNIFYNTNISEVTSTKDFVLMAAMDTMSLVDQLPNGNIRHGPADGKMFTFIYETDPELKALNELGADPELYADSTRTSLTTFRHLSLRLQPDEYYDYVTLRDKLKASFVDPAI